MSIDLVGITGAQGISNRPSALPLTANIAIEGDSQTNAATGAIAKLSTVLAERLSRRHQISLIGTGGARIVETMLPRTATFDALKSNTADLNIALLWGGTNDIAQGRSGSSTWTDGAKVWTQGRLAAGWDWVVLVACLPRGGTSSGGFNSEKNTYNQLQASEGVALGNVLYVNIAGDESDPSNLIGYYIDSTHNSPYFRIYYVDDVHVTTEGKGFVGDMIVDKLHTISIS